jgi:hypothetical protein
VEESDGDLMGDGVNIAARLEGFGDVLKPLSKQHGPIGDKSTTFADRFWGPGRGDVTYGTYVKPAAFPFITGSGSAKASVAVAGSCVKVSGESAAFVSPGKLPLQITIEIRFAPK